MVVLLERATEALLDQLQRELEKGRGRAEDFVFTTETGGPYCRNRISSKGIGQAATRAGLSKVGAQVLRRSAATLRAYAGVPKHVAAKEMGHTATVFERSYRRPARMLRTWRRRELGSRLSGSACDRLTNR
jgi:integrase